MIQLSSAGKRFGPKLLFENLDWLITPHDRVGLVGANGTGKSTLLKILGGMESLLRSAMQAKALIEEVDGEMQSLANRIFINGGTLVNIVSVARRKAERDKAEQRAKDAVAEIDATGVQVKDLDIGLLDFPCVVEGDVILLCWKLGEDKITHWHSQEEGFAGRKPIDERILRGQKKSN